MDCARVDEELIAFQLAALEGATRAAVEAHLTGCSRCVSSYLALKRALDVAEDAGAPSELMRARVRAEAVKQLTVDRRAAAATARRPRRAMWAIAATAAAMLLAPLVYRATRTTEAVSPTVATPQTPPLGVIPVKNETVDTARVTPENLAFL